MSVGQLGVGMIVVGADLPLLRSFSLGPGWCLDLLMSYQTEVSRAGGFVASYRHIVEGRYIQRASPRGALQYI